MHIQSACFNIFVVGRQFPTSVAPLGVRKNVENCFLTMTDLIYLVDVSGKFESWYKNYFNKLNKKKENEILKDKTHFTLLSLAVARRAGFYSQDITLSDTISHDTK
jgi:hypothetical protein